MGLANQEEFDAIDREVSAEVKAAMEAAMKSPEPDPATVYNFVYANDPYGGKRPS